MAKKKHKKQPSKEVMPDKPVEKVNEPMDEEKNVNEPKLTPGQEERHTKMSVAIYFIAAVFMGYVSLIIAGAAGNYATLAAGIVFAIIIGFVVQAALGKKQLKWLLGNGLIIYLFFWLVFWIFFYNYLGYAPIPEPMA